MTDTDYLNDQELFINTSAQTGFLLYSLKQEWGFTSLYVKANNIDLMCFKQKGASPL